MYRERRLLSWMCIVLTLGLIPCIQARASVVIAGTRVIYPAGDSEVTLRLSNKGSTAGLVQVWVDRGEEHATPTAIDVPFTVAPPISRIDPGKAQTLRIFYTGETLPQDRESVFWLNVLEVPPEPGTSSPGQNYLQMSVLSRIKLFFRPKGLPGEAESSPGALSWSLKKGEAGWILEVRNDTAYHVSFAGIEVSSSGGHATFDEGGMVAPKSAENFVLHGALSPAADAKVHYRTINDYGGVVEGEAPVTVSANPLR